jgi:fructan beta-fructosidase
MKSVLVWICVAVTGLAGAAEDLVVADFEGKDYGEWTVTGEAFGPGPAKGTLPHQMEVSGFRGNGLVTSFFNGDRTTGTLTSAEFTIERPNLNFLIGGGGWSNRTCMNLVVDGKVVRTAVGPNVVSGGSEGLAPAGWNVREFAGRKARIEIVDTATGGWGHINVDHIVQSERAPPPAPKPVALERSIILDKPYLLLPVRNGGRKGQKPKGALVVDGSVVREFDIDLADEPEWFAHLDVRAWRGKTAAVRVEKIDAGSKALDLVATSDAIWKADEVYREPLRGQLRFSSRRGWNNDPNGMVFADGEYHLYYQHNPYGWPWGNMHWGHAVSPDMVHWREEPIAIYPVRHGDWVFSGSAVVDRDNTSGWRAGTNQLIVAAFTSTGRGECIVYSNDRGRTFRECEDNPVVVHKGRDPRLLWHGASKQWVMAVYTEVDGKRWIAFHTSPDLKVWTFRSRIEGFYECPDLFQLGGKWVLTAASSEYMVGRFDGATFTPETPKLKGHLGRGYYAAQTFSHEPKGRVVQVGWFQTATPGMPFNQSMSLPNELGLVETGDGPRMTWTPGRELESLRAKTHRLAPVALREGAANPLAGVSAELVELRTEIEPGDAAEVAFTLRGLTVVYETAKRELVVNGHRAPAPLKDGRLTLAVYVDRNGSEVYACDGRVFVPMPFLPKADDRALSVAAKGGTARLTSLEVHELRGIWPGWR